MPKKTPWFSPSSKPARVGVYEMSGDLPYPYHYLDGEGWFNPEKSPKRCLQSFKRDPMKCTLYVDFQDWRGLTKEAK